LNWHKVVTFDMAVSDLSTFPLLNSLLLVRVYPSCSLMAGIVDIIIECDSRVTI